MSPANPFHIPPALLPNYPHDLAIITALRDIGNLERGASPRPLTQLPIPMTSPDIATDSEVPHELRLAPLSDD
jgi:hypothetical protein